MDIVSGIIAGLLLTYLAYRQQLPKWKARGFVWARTSSERLTVYKSRSWPKKPTEAKEFLGELFTNPLYWLALATYPLLIVIGTILENEYGPQLRESFDAFVGITVAVMVSTFFVSYAVTVFLTHKRDLNSK